MLKSNASHMTRWQVDNSLHPSSHDRGWTKKQKKHSDTDNMYLTFDPRRWGYKKRLVGVELGFILAGVCLETAGHRWVSLSSVHVVLDGSVEDRQEVIRVVLSDAHRRLDPEAL